MIFGDKHSAMDTSLARDYVNPNELMLMVSQLHLCESLFGDWSARVCLLMQDPADVDSLKNFHLKTGRPILSHSPEAVTNKRLVEWLQSVDLFRHVDIEGRNATNCGLYYANAIWFLKRKGGMSGAIKQRKLALQKSNEILVDTFDQLEKLELIIAFGGVAYDALKMMFHLEKSWPQARQNDNLTSVCMGNRKYLIGVTNHPKARGVSKDWMHKRLISIFNGWQVKQ